MNQAEASSRPRLPEEGDSRLLLAGLVACGILVIYLAVAFAFTHATSGLTPSQANELAPWTPYASKLIPIARGKRRGYTIHVIQAKPGSASGGTYGALAQTILLYPKPGGRYAVGLWLRAPTRSRVGVEINEFRGAKSQYPVDTSVSVTRKWRHFTFKTRIKGHWLGIAMYVYRPTKGATRSSFALRGLTMETLSG